MCLRTGNIRLLTCAARFLSRECEQLQENHILTLPTECAIVVLLLLYVFFERHKPLSMATFRSNLFFWFYYFFASRHRAWLSLVA